MAKVTPVTTTMMEEEDQYDVPWEYRNRNKAIAAVLSHPNLAGSGGGVGGGKSPLASPTSLTSPPSNGPLKDILSHLKRRSQAPAPPPPPPPPPPRQNHTRHMSTELSSHTHQHPPKQTATISLAEGQRMAPTLNNHHHLSCRGPPTNAPTPGSTQQKRHSRQRIPFLSPSASASSGFPNVVVGEGRLSFDYSPRQQAHTLREYPLVGGGGNNTTTATTNQRPFVVRQPNTNANANVIRIDCCPTIPPHRQKYTESDLIHDAMDRVEAEHLLKPMAVGDYLLRRRLEGNMALSLRSTEGILHIKLEMRDGLWVLGEGPKFTSIRSMLRSYRKSELPVRGAEHIRLRSPITVHEVAVAAGAVVNRYSS